MFLFNGRTSLCQSQCSQYSPVVSTSAWTLTALVCSRCENLAPLSGIRGNFVTFVQFVGNNQTLPLCLGSVAGGCMPSRSRVHCWKNVEREGMGWEGWLA